MASSSASAPKILLAKPGLVTAGSVSRREDETASHRARLPPIGSLNLLSDSWDFHIDRFLPFLTENTDFVVVGVIGPPGVGKSVIMNELYGFDGSSSGMLPPFAVQSEDIKAMARHATLGIEPRVSAERLILLDTQAVFSPSVLSEIMRPDGSSTISVVSGESLSAELAHELMGIQVDLLKHGIPDPSLLSQTQNSNLGPENKDKVNEGEEYMATPVFVRTKVHDQDLTPHTFSQMRKALARYFSTSSLLREKCRSNNKEHPSSVIAVSSGSDYQDSTLPSLFLIPFKKKDDFPRAQYESYTTSLVRLRDQILSMNCSFAKPISEREWLKNAAKIWELVKNSPVIAEYAKTLQSSGFFRR